MVIILIKKSENKRHVALKFFPRKSLLFFVLSMTLLFISTEFICTLVRTNTILFLNDAKSSESKITININGKEVLNTDEIIDELLRIRPYTSQHSHPSKRIDINICAKEEQLHLQLRRDSLNNQDYWIFCPSLNTTLRVRSFS